MIVIAFANPKGGTGKTTSALLLAEHFALSGANLGILDCDPNQNLVQWHQAREKAGKPTPFEVYTRPKEDEVVEIIDDLAPKHDYLIIDLEGTAAQIVTFALSRADLVVIPLEPNSVEGRHAARAAQLVLRTGKMLNRPLNYTLLFTRTNAAFSTKEERELRSETASGSVPVLPVGLVRRSAYTRIFGDYALLSELLQDVDAKDREQIRKAAANAREYAQAVADMLGANS